MNMTARMLAIITAGPFASMGDCDARSGASVECYAVAQSVIADGPGRHWRPETRHQFNRDWHLRCVNRHEATRLATGDHITGSQAGVLARRKGVVIDPPFGVTRLPVERVGVDGPYGGLDRDVQDQRRAVLQRAERGRVPTSPNEV